MAAEENGTTEDDSPGLRGLIARFAPMIGAGVAGLFVLILIGGEIYFAVKTRTLQSELTTVRKELKERGRVAGEQQAQLAALAQQVEAMKTALAAKSESDAKEEAAKAPTEAKPAEAAAKPVAEPAKPVAPAAAHKAPVAAEKQPVAAKNEAPKAEAPKAEAPKPAPAKAKASDAFSCDLAGKSPEEQAVILKRCVSVMDMPPPAGKR
ncbi:hypothetical protein [Propionivibrio dicarboxylicus]|uniref:Uncharacterized protein n=1 Tax=Propionivibrio dicarboxylicus TaxID=83767 RepID=A0A1G7ZLC0_9RHOO|nr:hypothetical protein [Propionivibrio dicarboxylicus]SDH09387.1 hypothetical protein SAMN05660652_01206 [Propionivibrio dicarboxylicus]